MGWGGMEKHCWNQKLLAHSYPLGVSRMFVIYIWVRFKCWIMWPPNAHEAYPIEMIGNLELPHLKHGQNYGK